MQRVDDTLITTSVRLTAADREFLEAVADVGAAAGMSGGAQLLIREVQQAWRLTAADFPLLPGEAALLAEVGGGTLLTGSGAEFVSLGIDLRDAAAEERNALSWTAAPSLQDQLAGKHGLPGAALADLASDLDAAPRAVSWALRWLIALWWRGADRDAADLVDSMADAGLPVAAPAISGWRLRGAAMLRAPEAASAVWLAAPALDGWDPADPADPPALQLNAAGPRLGLPGGGDQLPTGDLPLLQDLAARLLWRREAGQWKLRTTL